MCALRVACLVVLCVGFNTREAHAASQNGGGGGHWCPRSELEPVLQRILDEAPKVWGDSGAPQNTAPPWMDARRLAAGKAFVARFPLGIAYAHIHALYMLFAVPSVLDVLVYTGNSDTPDEAFVRYFDTVQGVTSWYKSDFFTPGTWGYEQLQRVRSLHTLVRLDMNEREERDRAAVRNRTRLHGRFAGCPISKALRRDLDAQLRRACPQQRDQRGVADNTVTTDGDGRQADGRRMWMSQYDMAVTQWAFVGPIIQFPQQYGMANITREDLDGFTHLWEVLGYTLGIEDRYNFCQGGYEDTLRRSNELLATVVLPSLREARPPWEYMARCMSDGLGYVIPGVSFQTQLANLLGSTLGAPAPAVQRMLSPLQRQSVAGYRGLMQHLRVDRGVLGTSFGPQSAVATLGNQLMDNLRLIPKEQVKKLRHQPPHRSKDCYPDLG